MNNRLVCVYVSAIVLAVAGCAQSAHQTGQDLLDRVIPREVLAQVDDSVTFSDVRAMPDTYRGRTVLFSGVALKSQRVKDRTEIEVMQLPTTGSMSPSDRRSASEGRFLALKAGEFLDPAIIERDTPLTIIGEVKGVTTRPLDEGDYAYPVVEITHLVNWGEVRSRDGSSSGYRYGGYPYGGYGFGPYAPWYYGFGNPFWGPYGMYPYGYYAPYFIPHGSGSGPRPSPPPASSVPPQFQKNR